MEGDTASVVGENKVNFDGLRGDINEVELQVRRMSNFGMGMEIQISDHARPEELEKRQQICALVLLCYITHSSHLLRTMSGYTRSEKNVENSDNESRSAELIAQLVQTEKCRDIIRMSPQAFLQLCKKLRSSGRMKDSTRVALTVEGQVAEFLYIVGHAAKSRTVPFLFHHSTETFNRCFDNVLRAIISLENELLIQPSDVDVPTQILNDDKFYPYFKDCIGAISVTHSRVKVPVKDAPRFCARKAGWEGSASYSRILKDALTRKDRLKLPNGKYYLGLPGPMPNGVLSPYDRVRYQLKEFSNHEPQNREELFNLRHSLLQFTAEKTFGVLKKRFPIIAGVAEPFFSFETMRRIIIACCILHNFLMDVDIDEQMIAEVDRELLPDEVRRSIPLSRRKE
ncbi:hypothetical protein L195_g003165 [Trifolium pratense]|uniref:Uncharacterized protein n=1 Tax=Trifolium pratense TaxID=57577 RepID=A0A2K3NUH5_TRIPR|nr:hypothetical protein L195_g003165 [Trifolium pratense]